MAYDSLPPNLPEPGADGAADHLEGTAFPSLALDSTAGESVDLSALTGRTVVYAFPMIGRPGNALPAGWDEFPGARGCTPQSCAFRDHYGRLTTLGTRVFGLSASELDYQVEAKARLELPFELLADPGFTAARALRLPTFTLDGDSYYKRLTMIIEDGVIIKVFYPVFPPNLNAGHVVAWLEESEGS